MISNLRISTRLMISCWKSSVTASLRYQGPSIETPMRTVSARAGGSDLLVTTRHDLKIGAGAALTLIEASVSIGETAGQANGLISIAVGDGGRLDQIKIGAAGAVADLATWRVHLASEATYRAFQLTPGAPLARNQAFVTFDGERPATELATMC